MFKYHNLIKNLKRLLSTVESLWDVLIFLFPLIWTWWFDLGKIQADLSSPTCRWAIFWAAIYIVFLLVRTVTKYRISRDERDAYRKQFMEQVDSITEDKYKMLCNEIHHSTRQGRDILLYDAHGVIRNILSHLKQLVSNMTDVSLSNISVNFVYKYHGEHEHWQTIDGSSSCSIGTLDDIVERKESMYHYLYANNHEYVFYNDKAAVDWHKYRPSVRDGDDKESWGSIYCKRILCTLHQDRFVDGILAISTYNEKFTPSKRKAVISQIEGLLNEAVSVFENPIKTEMASLFIRHEHIKKKQLRAIQLLLDASIVNGSEFGGDPSVLTEDERKQLLESAFPEFKKLVSNTLPEFPLLDTTLAQKTDAILQFYTTPQP